MSNTSVELLPQSTPQQSEERKKTLFAAGGVIGAILASTCCVVPLLLVAVGISGAWIGNLTALEPYKPYFAAVAFSSIGLGFREVYFKVKPSCADGSYCGFAQ